MKTLDRLAYTPTEAAEVASVSRPTIYRWMRLEGFPVARIGGCTRIPGGGVQIVGSISRRG